MLPISSVDLRNCRIYLEEFKDAAVNCLQEIPQGESEKYTTWTVQNSEDRKEYAVHIKKTDLEDLGISITALERLRNRPDHLLSLLKNTAICERLLLGVGKGLNPQYEYSKFFRNSPDRALLNRLINVALTCGVMRTSKVEGTPRVYIIGSHLFVSLKKLNYLGTGAYANVKCSVWITGLLGSRFVAKKKFKGLEGDYEAYEREVRALNMFQNKVGIIHVIAAGNCEGKLVIFLPIYDCSLLDWLEDPKFSLNLDEELTIFSQWLQGLATIAEKGIHGDLSFKNLLIRKKGPEGVIADFGSFRIYEEKKWGLTPITTSSPEYYKVAVVTDKQDVWALGLALQAMVLEKPLPCWSLKDDIKFLNWVQSLQPNWSLDYPVKEGTPPFLVDLINKMLHPDPISRLSAKEALDQFSEGWEAYKDKSTPP